MPRTLTWKHLTGEIVLKRTHVMGVLNVTPDSFSDGGRYLDPDVALLHGLEMADDGADIIDVGGESTRPGSDPIPAEEEWKRVRPVLEGLAQRSDVPLSIDTRKSEVAAKALRAGASIVNDVTALRDPKMVQVVARAGAGAILLHMRGEPKTMQERPEYRNVVDEIRSFLEERISKVAAGGVPREALAVDPGIGFGKTVEHNLQLLRGLDGLASLDRPIVVGVSRKSFIGNIAGGEPDERLPGSLVAATFAVLRGAHIVRAHDVYETVQAMRIIDALGSHA